MTKRKTGFWGCVLGTVLAYVSLWFGAWLMHVVPGYLEFAAFATCGSGTVVGIFVALYYGLCLHDCDN